MKSLIKILLILSSFYSFSQNLVNNGNFEDTVICPQERTFGGSGYISYIKYWVPVSNSSPDFYHTCSPEGISGNVNIPNSSTGYQFSKSGQAYSGFFFCGPTINLREYVTGLLYSSLIKDSLYEVSYFISTADNSKNASDRIGAYLSVNQVSQSNDGVLPYKPQIESDSGVILDFKDKWHEIKDTFRAAGGEKYITLGCFVDSDSLNWLTYNPPVYMGHGAYYYIDSVTVQLYKKPDTVLPEPKPSHSLYPIPASNELIISFKDLQPKESDLVLYDLAGRKTMVLSCTPSSSSTFKAMLPPSLASGVYFYRLFTDKNYFAGGKVLVVR
jgi:hypothetical protein